MTQQKTRPDTSARPQPVGWGSWFVAGLVRLRLRVRLMPKLVDFHGTEYRQRSFRMIMRHVQDPLSTSLA
ncbi:hypothetical protein TNCV_814121 [Trichonephila clavipes]|nr:hypothetical protein TNCV_814121 [Trichonephila clavipes]